MNNSILKFINTYKYELMIGAFTIGLLYYEQRNTPEFAIASSSWSTIKTDITGDGTIADSAAGWSAAGSSTNNEKIDNFRSFVSTHLNLINEQLTAASLANIPSDSTITTGTDLPGQYTWLYENWWSPLNGQSFMDSIGGTLNETIALEITHPLITLIGTNNFTKPAILGYYMKVFGKTGATWQNLLMPPTAAVPGSGHYESGSIYGSHALLELFYNDTDANKSLLGSSPGGGGGQGSNLIFRSLRYFLELNYENAGTTVVMDADTIFDAVDAGGVTAADKRSKGFFLKTDEPDGAAVTAQPETFQLNRSDIQITRNQQNGNTGGSNSIIIPSNSYNLEDLIRARITELNTGGTIVTQLRFELWTVANWKWLKTAIPSTNQPDPADIIANYVDISATMKSGNIILGVMPVVYIPRPSNITVNIGGTSVTTEDEAI